MPAGRLKQLSFFVRFSFVTQKFVLLFIKQLVIAVAPALDVVPTGQLFFISIVSSVLDI